jgi:glutamate racemase
MKKLKVVFTDSGLGGLPIMANFVKLAKQHRLAVETTFFNAQYSRDLGYKKMSVKQQIKTFDNVLDAIEKLYKPDIIAIACNTLSVVYYQTQFHKKQKTKVLDIIAIGQTLIKESKAKTIIEVAMPTTIKSKIYKTKEKNRIAIASDVMLPDAIENGYQQKIEAYLNQIFSNAKKSIEDFVKQDQELALFLGCTHFPIIKELFRLIAEQNNLNIKKILDPNKAFANKVYLESLNEKVNLQGDKLFVQVVSRMPFQEAEITNIAKLVKDDSMETAEALRNYRLDEGVF